MDMKQKITETYERLFRKAQEVYPGMCCTTPPPIKFDLTGRSAGQVHYKIDRDSDIAHSEVIRFNVPMFEINHETTDILESTVGHELCHFIAMVMYGYQAGKGHGTAWKTVMRKMGFKPERTHNYTLCMATTRTLPTFPYVCGCKGKVHQLTSIRESLMRNGRAYFCNKCHGELVKVHQTQPARMAALATAPTAPTMRQKRVKKSTGTKASQVEQILINHFKDGRGTCIDLIMQQCDMSKAGASTYYQNAKKKLGL